MKEAKCQFLSNIVSSNSHHPRILFNTTDSVVNPCTSFVAGAAVRICENFLYFLTDKVATIRQPAPSNLNVDLPVAPAHFAVFEQVELVSLSIFTKVVQHMKPTNCPLDIVTVDVFNIVLILVLVC